MQDPVLGVEGVDDDLTWSPEKDRLLIRRPRVLPFDCGLCFRIRE